MCLDDNANILFKENSNVLFNKNIATVNSGATSSLHNSSITFYDNAAVTFAENIAKYGTGGAIFLDVTHNTVLLNNKNLNFLNNIAKIAGNSLYLDVAKSCSGSYINNRIIGISTIIFISLLALHLAN